MQNRIAFITDAHLGDPTATSRDINPDKNLENVLRHITDDGIDTIVFGGDIGYDDKYGDFFRMMEKYKPDFKIILGNHDDCGIVAEHYTSNLGERFYHCTEDEIYKYIYLDSSSESIDEKQLAWLTNELTTLKKTIIFVHHPIVGCDTIMDEMYPLKNRDQVNDLLQNCKNPVTVFCGHYHMPDKRTQGKITQYVTPATSFQLRKHAPVIDISAQFFAYRIITPAPGGIRTQLVTNYYDSFITGPEH